MPVVMDGPKRCECGCGELTKRVHGLEPGYSIGDYRRFAPGHGRRLVATKRYGEAPGHGRRLSMHRWRAEQALGRELPPGAEVHHADGTKSKHAPLVICQDRKYHKLLHCRMRVKHAGGNPNTDSICGVCHQVKPFDAFSRSRARVNGVSWICRVCHAPILRALSARRRNRLRA